MPEHQKRRQVEEEAIEKEHMQQRAAKEARIKVEVQENEVDPPEEDSSGEEDSSPGEEDSSPGEGPSLNGSQEVANTQTEHLAAMYSPAVVPIRVLGMFMEDSVPDLSVDVKDILYASMPEFGSPFVTSSGTWKSGMVTWKTTKRRDAGRVVLYAVLDCSRHDSQYASSEEGGWLSLHVLPDTMLRSHGGVVITPAFEGFKCVNRMDDGSQEVQHCVTHPRKFPPIIKYKNSSGQAQVRMVEGAVKQPRAERKDLCVKVITTLKANLCLPARGSQYLTAKMFVEEFIIEGEVDTMSMHSTYSGFKKFVGENKFS